MITSVSTLYMSGQVIDRSVYQGSTYLGEHFDKPLTFDLSYTMPVPTTEAINLPTVPVSIVGNNLFMGRAEGYWIYKIYNNGNLVKTIQMVDQDFTIPIQYDRIESVCMNLVPEELTDDPHPHVPSPGMGLLVAMASVVAFSRRR
jgi:hypothetical protein